MAKPKQTMPGILPAPLTLEELHACVLEVFLFHVRTIGWLTDTKRAAAIVPSAHFDSELLLDPDAGPADMGLTYDDIRELPFAKVMDTLYEFAYFGRLDAGANPMEDESYYMWVSAIISDVGYGRTAETWGAYGASIDDSARKCVLVAETANARHMLEGGESFFYFHWTPSNAADAVGEEYSSLSVRQLALLSGMEEMSIRAAANPKRANPLRTHTEDGKTRIALDVAKAWLESKGRYVPITRYWTNSEIDLAKHRFKDIFEILSMLNARREMLAERSGADAIDKRLAAVEIGVVAWPRPQDKQFLDLEERHLKDEKIVRELADVLELPVELLILHIRKALASRQLEIIGYELDKHIMNMNQSKQEEQGR